MADEVVAMSIVVDAGACAQRKPLGDALFDACIIGLALFLLGLVVQ